MFNYRFFELKEIVFNRPRYWLKERRNILKFSNVVILLLLGLILLLIISLGADDFSENFSLNLLTEIIGALLVIILLEGYVGRISEKMQKEIKVLEKSWDKHLIALDRDEITWDKAKQSGQWLSWYKWTQGGDVTGWTELMDEVHYGQGISPRVRWAVEFELQKLREKAYSTGIFSDEEEEIEEKLQALLNYSSAPTQPDNESFEDSNSSTVSEGQRMISIAGAGILCALIIGIGTLLKRRIKLEK